MHQLCMPGAVLWCCLICAESLAQEQVVPPDRAPAPASAGKEALPPEAAARNNGPFVAPLMDDKLSGLRGGTDTPWSDMRLQGAVSGNSAVAVVTGNNVITEGSFANASGLPMVIQNSGANVLIQNATIVNIQFK